jgi:hypothetical protein
MLIIGVVWAVIDVVVTPADRWVNGIALALPALAGLVAFGYQRFRRSKAHPGR